MRWPRWLHGQPDSTGATGAWPLLATHYLFKDQGLVLNYTRTFSPTIVNEFMGGARHSIEAAPALRQEDLDKLNRKTLGMTLGTKKIKLTNLSCEVVMQLVTFLSGTANNG